MVERKKVKWLSRKISAPAPYLALCLSEQEYKSAVRCLKINDAPPWVMAGAAGAMHPFDVRDELACVVCMSGWENCEITEILGLLIHESVHVFQKWCEHYREENPGIEQQAYGVQCISQTLISDFIDRLGRSST